MHAINLKFCTSFIPHITFYNMANYHKFEAKINLMSSPEKYAKTASWISIIANLLLFIIKYLAGIASHSLALIADAWHTLSDSLSSIIVLISTRITQIPADEEHPFGHGRADLIASIIIGVILAVVGFNFFWEGANRLMDHTSVEYKNSAIIVIVISILAKEGLAQYAFWASKKSGFQSLKADGWHHRSDSISSILVLVGIFVNQYFWWVDSVLSMLISFLLFHATYEIMRNAISPLMGEAPSSKLIAQIDQVCNEVAGRDIDPHHFHIHRYGRHAELTFHIRLDKDMSVEEAHDIAKKIELKVRKKLKIEATIHYDPA